MTAKHRREAVSKEGKGAPIKDVMRQAIDPDSKSARRTGSFHNTLDSGIALITREALVAAIPRQRDCHLPTCHFGHHVGGQLRRVSERFVEDLRNPRNEVQRILWREIQLAG